MVRAVPALEWNFIVRGAFTMSLKLYLSFRPKTCTAERPARNVEFRGDYVVGLRADTPESCLASAAYDTLLRYLHIDNGEDFDVTTRDARGQIVLDTQLPAIGAMASYGLSVTRLEPVAV